MSQFSYKARDTSGEDIIGIKDASDRYDLARQLRTDGYILISAEEVTASGEKKKLIARLPAIVTELFRRVSVVEKIIFSKNLGVMISAGMPLVRALDALSRESRNIKFKKVVADVIDYIRRGRTLAEAFSAHPDVFPAFYVAMVEAGEKSGKLQESLGILASQMQADHDIVRKVRGAIIYPAIVLIAMVGIGIFMMIYVVPTLTQVFTELKVNLPPTTQLIIAISNLLVNYGLFVFPLSIVLIAVAIRARKWPPVKSVLDRFILRIPIIGVIAKKFNTARTARTMSSLISAGVHIVEAIDITSRVLQNHLYVAVLTEAKVSIQKGEQMSKVFLKNDTLYPSLMGEMLAVGEETGESSRMLNEVALFYEGQVSDATRDLSTVVEPVLMLVIGSAVGFFAVSMIQPMYSISSNI